MTTIPELLSLDEVQLTVRFYRDVLGRKASNNTITGKWYVENSGTGLHATEELAWANVPPVSPEVWLAMADRLEHESGESCDALWDTFEELQQQEYGAGLMPFSIAMPRAVMIASIFTHQQKETV